MKALIQHNFSSGLGDCIVAVYEYLETTKTLIKLGYSVELILNLEKNVYLYNEHFFEIFNKEVFDIFEKISITKIPITLENYNGLKKVYTLSNASAGLHWWDLYLSNPNEFVYDILSIYPYQENKTPNNIKIFNEKIYDDFFGRQKLLGLSSPYQSIYFRTMDRTDETKLYDKYIDIINEKIFFNEKIFICSNSFLIKNKIKNINLNKVVTHEIPFEKEIGNHWLGSKPNIDKDILLNRTKLTIFDMLSLSNSTEILHITEWNRTSNFLIFSKINKVNIVSCYDY